MKKFKRLLALSTLIFSQTNIAALNNDSSGWACEKTSGGSWVCEDANAPEITSLPEPALAAVKSEATLPVPKAVYLPALEITDNVNIEAINTADAYANCKAPAAKIVRDISTDGKTRVQSDSASLDITKQVINFSGETRLRQDDKAVDADIISFNNITKTASASGNVVIKTSDVIISGESGNWNTATHEGQMNQANYQLRNSVVHGSAGQANINNNDTTSYQDISYTTCQPGNTDWQLLAKELEIDHKAGIGVVKEAKLEFLGLPIAYVPELSFPLDRTRKSGLLAPSFGHSSNTGIDISAPYYFNLAPNYDATLTPRIMSKRGFLLGGEFRYLTDNHRGELTGEILPNDSEYVDGGVRGALSLRQNSRFGQRLFGNINVQYASDSDYLEDLGDSLAVSSTRYLSRNASLNYFGDYWDIKGEVQYYQTIDNDIPEILRPYKQLPKVSFNWQQNDVIGGISVDVTSEYTFFDKNEGVTGQRFDLYPAISYPINNAWGFVEPKIAGRYTSYSLDNQVAGNSDNPDRVLGSFSLDSGLYFDNETSWFNTKVTQTLEPRLFYLYTPEEDQADLPLFDTTVRDFNFDNLFRHNSFNGVDRMADANQLTAALTSRFLDGNSGEELLRLSLGQIYYFDDRLVTLSESNTEVINDESSSQFVAELRARLSNKWNIRLGAQYDPHNGSGQFNQGLAQLSYHDSNQRVFNVSYRLREISELFDSRVEQTDIAMIWPVTQNMSLIGRWNYSIEDAQTLESLAGFEYGRNCCWKLRTVARQYLDNDTDDKNLSLLVQLQLNGLGSLGNDISHLLADSVYGYTDD